MIGIIHDEENSSAVVAVLDNVGDNMVCRDPSRRYFGRRVEWPAERDAQGMSSQSGPKNSGRLAVWPGKRANPALTNST